jgi:hypothetical protein
MQCICSCGNQGSIDTFLTSATDSDKEWVGSDDVYKKLSQSKVLKCSKCAGTVIFVITNVPQTVPVSHVSNNLDDLLPEDRAQIPSVTEEVDLQSKPVVKRSIRRGRKKKCVSCNTDIYIKNGGGGNRCKSCLNQLPM